MSDSGETDNQTYQANARMTDSGENDIYGVFHQPYVSDSGESDIQGRGLWGYVTDAGESDIGDGPTARSPVALHAHNENAGGHEAQPAPIVAI